VEKPEFILKRHALASPWTYAMLDQLQRKIAQRVLGGGAGALILSEVAPVVTVGRRTDLADILVSRETFEEKGIEIIMTDRGGLATYHGPGQWVLFCVDTLENLIGDSRGVRKVVEQMLEIEKAAAGAGSVIRAGAETGVWSARGQKLASVGIHIEQRVVLHGLALNVYRTPESFFGIRLCGLDAQPGFILNEPDENKHLQLAETLRKETLSRFWLPKI